MIKKTRNHLGILLLAACFIFAAPAAGHADDLFRFYLEGQGNGFYGDNVPFRTSNKEGDFGSVLVAGCFLDYTSAARYAFIHYDTFAQLFLHQTRYDRAGEGQFFNAVDDENLSPTTKLRLDELYYRDATALVQATTSDQTPQFNSSLALLLLANDQASVNWFNARLWHNWGRNWSSEVGVHQTTFWNNASSNSNIPNSTAYYQGATAATDYYFNRTFSLGAGYRFYSFMFSRPGIPGEVAHWPVARVRWQPTENLYFFGTVGAVFSHQQGTSGENINPGGLGLLEYRFHHGHVSIYGGQEPSLTPTGSGAGELSGVRGSITYNFTSRLVGNAGAGFYDATGPEFSGQIVSWGIGFSDRVNQWLTLNTRFIQLRREQTSSNQFLPNGVQSGASAVGDYIVVGCAVSIEAFRWSWQ